MKAFCKSAFVLGMCMGLSACSSTPRYEFSKEGATDYDRSSALAECTYQIKLGKVDEDEEKQLLSLCMEGKGYRSVLAR